MVNYHSKNQLHNESPMVAIVKLHAKNAQVLVNLTHCSEIFNLLLSSHEIVNLQHTHDDESDERARGEKGLENLRSVNALHQRDSPEDAVEQHIEDNVAEDHEIVEWRYANVKVVAFREETESGYF